MLVNIRIVMVRTFHPGNIGSAARAMKTMGITQLYLISPKDFPSYEATRMARSATDIVDNAVIVDSVYEAVKDCTMVIASTARPRGFDLPAVNPEQCAHALLESAKTAPVALVFGPERMGLFNEDLQHAKYRVTIPTNPDCSSLNIASAIQTLSYEIYKQSIATDKETDPLLQRKMPTTDEVEQFYVHLEETLTGTGFIMKKHPGKVIDKLRQLFDRAQPDVKEMNILRGVLASIQRPKKE